MPLRIWVIGTRTSSAPSGNSMVAAVGGRHGVAAVRALARRRRPRRVAAAPGCAGRSRLAAGAGAAPPVRIDSTTARTSSRVIRPPPPVPTICRGRARARAAAGERPGSCGRPGSPCAVGGDGGGGGRAGRPSMRVPLATRRDAAGPVRRRRSRVLSGRPRRASSGLWLRRRRRARASAVLASVRLGRRCRQRRTVRRRHPRRPSR